MSIPVWLLSKVYQVFFKVYKTIFSHNGRKILIFVQIYDKVSWNHLLGDDPLDEKRFAILIDGENISPKYIKTILDEISNKGTATYKRIYGDWTTAALGGWKEKLLD